MFSLLLWVLSLCLFFLSIALGTVNICLLFFYRSWYCQYMSFLFLSLLVLSVCLFVFSITLGIVNMSFFLYITLGTVNIYICFFSVTLGTVNICLFFFSLSLLVLSIYVILFSLLLLVLSICLFLSIALGTVCVFFDEIKITFKKIFFREMCDSTGRFSNPRSMENVQCYKHENK